MNWWYNEYQIMGERKTPTQYLKETYTELSDREIAKNLSYYCDLKVTKNAVRKRRYRLELYKETQEETNTEQFNEFVTENNYGNAKAKTSNLDELIALCNIDTGIWEVESFKTWQGYSKIDGELVTIPLASAAFVRKQPIPVLPLIQPMRGEVVKRKLKTNTSKVKTALIFSDCHFGFSKDLRNAKLTPFHNRSVLELVGRVARDVQPDRIDILGDILDLPEWSDKFLRSPEFYWTTQPSIIEAYYFLSVLRFQCPDAEINLHSGNHDKRIENAIEKYLPVAYDLRPTSQLNYPSNLSLPSLLDLDSLNINFVADYPNDSDFMNNNVELMHGKKALAPFRTVQDIAKNSQHSNVFGHIHRLEMASWTHWTGRAYNPVQAVSCGCTCWLDGRVPGVSKTQQWQNGFVLSEYTDATQNYTFVPIDNNQCVAHHHLFTVKDGLYSDDLPKLYPDWNW